MGIFLGAWAGDHAGSVTGRQANRLLVSLTHTDATFPTGLLQWGEFKGRRWYFNLSVTCLTPGSRPAMATAVDDVGDYVWSIEVAEVDWGDSSKSAWSSGVHLFSAMLLAPVGHQSGVIATAIIDDDHDFIDVNKEKDTYDPYGWPTWARHVARSDHGAGGAERGMSAGDEPAQA